MNRRSPNEGIMAQAILWGALLRFLQAALQAAPFIFTGLCITGLLHRLMGQQHTRRLFGSNSVASLFQSWLIGMLLPGCSLGVIPIVKQLRRSGIAVGTIFAFALSSPLFDPLSMLYGLTLSKPITIVAFALCSLVVVTISGSLFDRLFPNTEVVVEEPPATPHGIKRLIAVLVVMARETVSGTAGLFLCGLAGTALLSTLLPPSSLGSSMSHNNPYSPLLMTAIAIPAYATPMTAMGQLGSMFQHGNSVGAAFILLIFGAGMNLGLLIWMVLNYGWKKSLVWFGLMLLIVVGLSYGIERPLYPTDVEPAAHTHAFDVYCQPFLPNSPPIEGYPAEIWKRLTLGTQLHEMVGAAFVAALIGCGLLLKALDRRWVIETWLNRQPAVSTTVTPLKWDIVVPGPVLAGVGLLGIVAMSIVGCFTYYPDPSETLEQLNLAKVEALSAAISGNKEHALHWIPICEGWNRRLQVGAYLRHGRLSDYHRMKARVFADKLEFLEHAVEEGDRAEAKEYALAAQNAYSRLRTAFSEDL
jgi:uncharacterized membrane protein YraQ (UPF0718 family)